MGDVWVFRVEREWGGKSIVYYFSFSEEQTQLFRGLSIDEGCLRSKALVAELVSGCKDSNVRIILKLVKIQNSILIVGGEILRTVDSGR